MTHRFIMRAMWVCIILIFLSFGALSAQEILTVPVPEPRDTWGVIADKVPGLLTLVFLVIVFFKHLDKKNDSDVAKAREYRESMVAVVSEFKNAMDSHTTAIGKLEDKVGLIVFRSSRD